MGGGGELVGVYGISQQLSINVNKVTIALECLVNVLVLLYVCRTGIHAF